MDLKPSFSVGIPTYNQATTIRETLLSLLNQEVAPDRIVVSNNHCTDNTAEILEEFRTRVEIISPPEHLTSVASCNYVASYLDEDWFSLLSSDDVAYPNYIRVLREGMERSPRAVLVRAGWNNINEDSQVVNEHRMLSVRRIVSPPKTLMESRLGPKTGFAAFAVKTAVWREAGSFPLEFAWLGDWALWVRLAPLGDFIYEDTIISGYRVKARAAAGEKRLLDELKEIVMVFRDIMPQAAAECGQQDTRWIRKSARESFLRKLESLSNEVPPEARQPYREALAEWADLVGETKRLKAFADGQPVPYVNFADSARELLRPVFQRLKP